MPIYSQHYQYSLGMYGPRLHPKLPDSVKILFENPVFRCAVLFLVAYMAHRDFTGALVISIVFVVTREFITYNSST